jgi:hypothetical protein
MLEGGQNETWLPVAEQRCRVWIGMVQDLPNFTINVLHHAIFGLLDGVLEALSLAVAGHRCRSMANSTVWIHPDDPFSRSTVSSIHLSWHPRHDIRSSSYKSGVDVGVSNELNDSVQELQGHVQSMGVEIQWEFVPATP